MCTFPGGELTSLTQLYTLRDGEFKTITQLCTPRDGESKTITQLCTLGGDESKTTTQLYTLRDCELTITTQLCTLWGGELKTITQLCAFRGYQFEFKNTTELTHELSCVAFFTSLYLNCNFVRLFVQRAIAFVLVFMVHLQRFFSRTCNSSRNEKKQKADLR